jgi:Skp family chaperone for outer membrane proteins
MSHFALVALLSKISGHTSLNAGTSSTTKSTAKSLRDTNDCQTLSAAHNKLRNAESMTAKMANAASVAMKNRIVACSGTVATAVASAKNCSAVSMRVINIMVKDSKTITDRIIKKTINNRTPSIAHSELVSTARSPAAQQNGVTTSPSR